MKDLINKWVWSKYAEELVPDRKEGSPVPVEYLNRGDKEYYPYPEWVKKGFVYKLDNDDQKRDL